MAELETYLQDLTTSGDPPGLSVAVMQPGELVYSAASGLADGPNLDGEKLVELIARLKDL